MMRKYFIHVLILFFALITTGDRVSAQRTKSSLSSGELRSAEKGLKDNRYFFYFINSSVSNLGDDEEKKIFREAIQRDILAQVLYMKFLFRESFQEIRKSQKLLIDCYRLTLKRDIRMTKELLNGFTKAAAKSNDNRARHYLMLGYRDVAEASQYLEMADNYRETLYSIRLYKYVRAIKLAKHGKRYAFYSIIESNIPIDKKIELGYLGFDELKKRIESVSGDKKDLYLLIHYDNYYRTKEKSFFDVIWDDPRLNELEEYRQYFELR